MYFIGAAELINLLAAGPSAVNDELASRHEFGSIRCEVEHPVGNILRLSKMAYGVPAQGSFFASSSSMVEAVMEVSTTPG